MNSVIDNQLDNRIKVAVIVPDRGDRPEFLVNCKRMINSQTLKPEVLLIMDYAPESNLVDITQRYKRGYELINKLSRDIDVIAFMENDDWYHVEYLEQMTNAWNEAGRPELFGTNFTIYYHLKLRAYYRLHHESRASMMNTMIKPHLNMAGVWPIDREPFTDMALWNSRLKKQIWRQDRILSIGMKHGVGKCGGRAHVESLQNYTKRGKPDNGFLRETLDVESFQFYNTVFLEPYQEDFITD